MHGSLWAARNQPQTLFIWSTEYLICLMIGHDGGYPVLVARETLKKLSKLLQLFKAQYRHLHTLFMIAQYALACCQLLAGSCIRRIRESV